MAAVLKVAGSRLENSNCLVNRYLIILRKYNAMQGRGEFHTLYEPRCEKTCLRGFRPGRTQTRLCNHTRWLEA